MKYKLFMRIPGWSNSEIVPGDLYTTQTNNTEPGIRVNGVPSFFEIKDGYAIIEREWKKGDWLDMAFPMEPRKVVARKELKQDSNRIAIQRGPIVYCVEGADNNNKAWNIIIPPNTIFKVIDYKILDENVKALTAEVPIVNLSADGTTIKTEKKKIIAIPYYTWANRGKNEMQVWLPTKITDIKINY